MPDYGLKDSGARRDFSTGSRRDMSDGKTCPDLISPFFRFRLGSHLSLGAGKYGKHNWTKGQPSSVYRESLDRHLLLADMGLDDEDHLSAAAFNLMGIIHNQEMAKLGLLPDALNDWPVDWDAQLHGGDPHYPALPVPPIERLANLIDAAAKYASEVRKLLKAKLTRHGNKDQSSTRENIENR